MEPGLKTVVTTSIALGLCMAAASCTTTRPPPLAPDGLQRVEQTGFREAYVREGTVWAKYTYIAIVDCTVEFRKNWQRDQNEDVPFSVRDEDVVRIKTALAAEFRDVFSQELTAAGKSVVTTAGPNVLALRPAIVDLDIIAPDDRQATNQVTLADSAGSMTLYLELYDSATDELLARIVDPRESIEFGDFSPRNDVTNLSDARRVLEKWATMLGALLTADTGAAGSRR